MENPILAVHVKTWPERYYEHSPFLVNLTVYLVKQMALTHSEQNRWLQPSTAVRGIFTPHVLLYLFSNAKLARLTIKPRPAEEEYPDLTQHNNHMAKYLTLDVYKRLRQRCTPNGFTIDNVIQTGVDNPGKRTHIVCQGQG